MFSTDEIIAKADILIEALPYIQEFHNAILLVKFGGSAMEVPEITQSVLRDIAFLASAGLRPIIVHGGGKAITAELTRQNVPTQFIPYDMDTLFGLRNDSYLKYGYTITHETFDDSIGSYAFAGHDSILWELVRACPDKLREVAETIRSNMSLEYVLQVFNEQEMGNWCERIYNKDGIFKYVTPLIEGVKTTTGTMTYDYLYGILPYARLCLLSSPFLCHISLK